MEARESMTSDPPYTHDDLNVSDKSDSIEKYLEIFGENPVFNSVKPGEKAGFKNWDNPDKLKTANEIGFLLSRHRNIAIRLGVQTDRGYTVVFDKESYGNVPNSLLERISEIAVASWQSQSDGSNNLLTVTKDAYEYLDQFKQQVTFEGDKHDLELLTSGYALVPPSRIDEDHRYDSLAVDPQAPTLDIDSIRDILGDIPVSEKNEGNTTNQSEKPSTAVEIDTLPDSFDIESHFKDNVAYFDEKMKDKVPHFHQYMTELTKNQQRIKDKWDIEPKDQSENEKFLAIDLAWYFQNNTKIIQYIFENVLPAHRDNDLKFNKNKYHRKDCLDLDEYVSRPYFIKGIGFSLRQQIAERFLEHEILTSNELYEDKIFNTRNDLQSYSKKQIDRGLELFTELGLIDEIEDNIYKNESINEKYVQELGKICEKDEYKPIKYPCEN